jgi:hypothetical protein
MYAIPEEIFSFEKISGQIYGGFKISPARIRKNMKEVKMWIEDSWISDYPEDQAAW